MKLAIILWLFIMSFMYYGMFVLGSKEKAKKIPVSVEYFKQGDILYPDYACPDTLIVIDALILNKAYAYIEQDIEWGSDADCDGLIHQYCRPINDNQP